MQKKLIPEDVCFLIVHSSFTNSQTPVTLDSIYAERVSEGYSDVGYHYLIDRDADVHKGVPIDREGSHTPRFADRAIGLLIAGGKGSRGKPSDNYSKEQKSRLAQVIAHLKVSYPDLKVLGAGSVLGGTSPHFNLEAYQ